MSGYETAALHMVSLNVVTSPPSNMFSQSGLPCSWNFLLIKLLETGIFLVVLNFIVESSGNVMTHGDAREGK